ncbi:MAG: copper chaperone PCu(A)C [Pseudomonadota bacterium]
MFKHHTLAAVAALVLLPVIAPAPAPAHDFKAGDLTIDHPWSRPGLPNRPAAAYLEIVNAGSGADRLLSASSPAFETIELHRTEKQGDVMQMLQTEAIAVPAGETVALEPGGLHLMLFGAEAPFAEGESFPVTLTFENAGTVEVTVNVEKRAGAAMDHSGMDHGSMNHGAMKHGSGEAKMDHSGHGSHGSHSAPSN